MVTALAQPLEVEIVPVHVMVEEDRLCPAFADAHRLLGRQQPVGKHLQEQRAKRDEHVWTALDLVLTREHVVDHLMQRLVDLLVRGQRRRRPQQRSKAGEIHEASEWQVRVVLELHQIGERDALRMRARQRVEVGLA